MQTKTNKVEAQNSTPRGCNSLSLMSQKASQSLRAQINFGFFLNNSHYLGLVEQFENPRQLKELLEKREKWINGPYDKKELQHNFEKINETLLQKPYKTEALNILLMARSKEGADYLLSAEEISRILDCTDSKNKGILKTLTDTKAEDLSQIQKRAVYIAKRLKSGCFNDKEYLKEEKKRLNQKILDDGYLNVDEICYLLEKFSRKFIKKENINVETLSQHIKNCIKDGDRVEYIWNYLNR